jgi:hypothetical protein
VLQVASECSWGEWCLVSDSVGREPDYECGTNIGSATMRNIHARTRRVILARASRSSWFKAIDPTTWIQPIARPSVTTTLMVALRLPVPDYDQREHSSQAHHEQRDEVEHHVAVGLAFLTCPHARVDAAATTRIGMSCAAAR